MMRLNPTPFVKRAFKKLWSEAFFDNEKIEREENHKLQKLGNLEVALSRLNKLFQEKYGRNFDFNSDSIHYLLWSLFSLERKIKRILEIGTFEGEGTYILAKLFPEAEIITVDLPEDDPILRLSYERHSKERYSSYLEKQKRNTDIINVTSLRINSFFLPSFVKAPFDLIWVDGGHLFPEVAWDIGYAWYLCASGGFIMCDDVIPTEKRMSTAYISSESYQVLKYLKERTTSSIELLLKRRNPLYYSSVLSRKYVALVKKP